MLELGILLGLGAALCWGLSDLFAKVAVTREKNFLPAHITGFCGIIILMVYNFLFPPANFPPLTIVYGLLPVGFLMSLGWWLFYHSLQKGLVSIQSAIGASYGLPAFLLGIPLLNEYPSILQMAGALLAMVSTFFLSLASLNIKKMKFDSNAMLALIASLCWGIALVLLAPFAKAYPPQIAVFSHVLFSFIFVTIFVLISGKQLFPKNRKNFIPAILASVDSIGLIFYYSAAAFFYTTLLAPVSSIYPIFTLAFAGYFLREKLKNYQFVSIIAILIGIIMISYP
ncbi:MAG: DMT family transporter [Candidatus Micrarchaeota archaeon]